MINFFNRLFVKPFTTQGVLYGALDVAVKIVAIAFWIYAAVFVVTTIYGALMYEYNPKVELWWICYCFVILLGATLIAYPAVFERKKY
ncbi:MAG: hypothetical protein FWF35_05735 [Elusimicrobia bacterium]|nr:hypothetical protein [Elusimicrobiota bacterium]